MRTIFVDEEGHINISDLLEGTNVSPDEVYFYYLNKKEDGTLQVTLFDENKKQIHVKDKQ